MEVGGGRCRMEVRGVAAGPAKRWGGRKILPASFGGGRQCKQFFLTLVMPRYVFFVEG